MSSRAGPRTKCHREYNEDHVNPHRPRHPRLVTYERRLKTLTFSLPRGDIEKLPHYSTAYANAGLAIHENTVVPLADSRTRLKEVRGGRGGGKGSVANVSSAFERVESRGRFFKSVKFRNKKKRDAILASASLPKSFETRGANNNRASRGRVLLEEDIRRVTPRTVLAIYCSRQAREKCAATAAARY